MELQLDHIVHYIKRNPREAVEKWQDHRFQAVMGGSHEKWGTHNSLLYTGTSYIEYLAVEKEEIAKSSNNPLIIQLIHDLNRGEGIGQICFRTNDIMNVKTMLEQKGYNTFPIFPGSRKRDDGSIIKWKMLFINEILPMPFPFFIEWEQPEEERFLDLKQRGMIDSKLENHHVEFIFIASKNGEQTARKWSRIFDFPLSDTVIDTTTSSKNTTISCGTTKLVFCEPTEEEGIVFNTLQQRGERPFMLQFKPLLFPQPLSLFDSLYQ